MDKREVPDQRVPGDPVFRRVNVGCGADFRGDYDVYVDRYIQPVSRGQGVIEVPEGKRFVKADAEALPFLDGAFEHATCTDVLEHLEHPALACQELNRVAFSGWIRCPGFFDEQLFGKDYHLWMTVMRGNKVWFFRKRPWEDRPFGSAVKDAVRPGVRDWVPKDPGMRKIREEYDRDGPDWKLFGQQLRWEGRFKAEEIL